MLHFVNEDALKCSLDMRTLWGRKICPPELNKRSHAALDGKGVLSSKANGFREAHRPLQMEQSSTSEAK